LLRLFLRHLAAPLHREDAPAARSACYPLFLDGHLPNARPCSHGIP